MNRLGFFYIFGSSYRKINIYIVSVDNHLFVWCEVKSDFRRLVRLDEQIYLEKSA